MSVNHVREHHAKTRDDYDDVGDSSQDEFIAQETRIWRSLLLSALRRTAYPYCQYIRVFDLNTLRFTLKHSARRGKELLVPVDSSQHVEKAYIYIN